MSKVISVCILLLSVMVLIACGDTNDQTPPEVVQYTISFNADGGDPLADFKRNKDATLGSLPVTTKAGYSFEGWFLDSAKTQRATSSTVVTGHLTLFAMWTLEEVKEEFTVSFDVDGGVAIQSIKMENGDLLGVLPTPKKDGYNFIGWFTNSEKTTEANSSLVVDTDITLYAKFEIIIIEYTLTLNTMGGVAIDAIKLESGSQIAKPADPVKDGYKFVSWTTDEAGKNVVVWPLTLNKNMTIYAQWNEKIEIGQYLQTLFNSYKFDPQEILPEKMRAGGKLTTQATIEQDYSSFVDVYGLTYGYGEQWQMVLDNLEQAQTFFNVLNTIDAISATSITAFNNYLDSNPSDEADYEFTEGIYNIHIQYEADILIYIVEYQANIPIFGEQAIQLYLNYNIETGNKSGRVQIGDANAIKYEVNEEGYTIASKYLGFRTSFIEVKVDEDDKVTGQIHEHMTVSGKSLSSAAQFYVDDNHLNVVGNKAGAMLGFSGTIVETYNPNTGILLGYKVKESLSSIVYNTFFFNLSNQTGITTIKYVAQDESSAKEVFINGSTTKFATKNFGGISLKTASRRYDIEFRTQYVYVLEDEVMTKVAVEIPMLFVQAEKYDDLSTDIVGQNSMIALFTLNVSTQIKTEITNNYETLIPIFDTEKELRNYAYIQDYIGSKVE